MLEKLKTNPEDVEWSIDSLIYIILFNGDHVRESSTQWNSVNSEIKGLCPIRNIIFILTTLLYDAIMKLLKHKGWSVEAWLV